MRPEGSTAIHVPWLITARPKRDALISSLRISSKRFEPSDTAPTVLSFQAGRIAAGGQLEPVALLELRLRGPDGERLGVLAQLRDLLPGRYAFGLTGRDAEGRDARAGPLPPRADRLSDGPRRAEPRFAHVHHSVNRPPGLILAA